MVWAKNVRPFVSPTDAAACLLQVLSRSAYGTDDYSQSYNDTGDPTTSYIVTRTAGPREFVVQVRLDMFAANVEALDVLDTMAALLWLPSVSDQFKAINHSLQATSDTYDVSGSSVDNRAISSAVMELTINSTSCLTEDGAPGLGWIDTWNGGQGPLVNATIANVRLPALICRAVCG